MRDLGTAQVIQGDARHLPLDDDSVDLVVTSPPYFALRSYQDGGEHYDGQIGSEGTPAEFVAALLEVTRECVRVLKPSGSLWVNLGDKYSQRAGQNVPRAQGGSLKGSKVERAFDSRPSEGATWDAAPPKSLIGIPWRYALACIDDLGLILRAELIWSKPNGLPESVTDRVRRSHEQWFHFTLEPRYFSAVDEIREPQVSTAAYVGQRFNGSNKGGTNGYTAERQMCEPNPLGKLPGSVWTIPTQPLTVPDHLGVDHFAAFPTEWPKRIIQGWSPTGVCSECGEGRRPVTSSVRTFDGEPVGPGEGSIFGDERTVTRNKGVGNWRFGTDRSVSGYACACTPTRVLKVPSSRVNRDPRGYDDVVAYTWDEWTPAPTTPALVLDPFGGTGTTALVAKALGRHGITLDMSADYSRLAEWRTNDRDSLAKVLDIAKAPAPDEHQDDLLTLLEGP